MFEIWVALPENILGTKFSFEVEKCLNLAYDEALRIAEPQGYSEIGSGSAAVK